MKVTRGQSATAPVAPVASYALSSPGFDPAQKGYQVHWSRPSSDNGQVVLGYRVTALPSGRTQVVPGGDATQADLDGFPSAVVPRFKVQAVNQVGTSPYSNVVTGEEGGPIVTITSPAGGATVGGDIEVRVTATADPRTGSHVDFVSASIGDGFEYADTAFTAPYVLNLTGVPEGPQVLHVTAQDTSGRLTDVTRSITVAHSRPVITVTAPTAGAVVSGDTVPYTFTVDHPEQVLDGQVDVYLDDIFYDTVIVSGPTTSGVLPLFGEPAGNRTITVHGSNLFFDEVVSSGVTFSYTP